MKAIALISGVIFTAIIITAIFLAYQMSVPIVKNMRSSAEIEQMKNTFSAIDNIIQTVSSEGPGSRRALPIKTDYGEIAINGDEDEITYSVDVNFPYISPRTQQSIGGLTIGSNLDVNATETEYMGVNAFSIENEHIKLYIRSLGNSTDPKNCDTSQLILGIYQKDDGKWFDGSVEIIIDNRTESRTGTGYTVLEGKGDDIPYGKATVFINTSYINYYIEFILESGADFIQIRGYHA